MLQIYKKNIVIQRNKLSNCDIIREKRHFCEALGILLSSPLMLMLQFLSVLFKGRKI